MSVERPSSSSIISKSMCVFTVVKNLSCATTAESGFRTLDPLAATQLLRSAGVSQPQGTELTVPNHLTRMGTKPVLQVPLDRSHLEMGIRLDSIQGQPCQLCLCQYHTSNILFLIRMPSRKEFHHFSTSHKCLQHQMVFSIQCTPPCLVYLLISLA